MYYAILFFTALSSLWLSSGIGDGIRVPKEIACILGFWIIYSLSTQYRAFKSFWLKGFIVWAFVLTAFYVKQITCFYEIFYVVSGIVAISSLSTSYTLIPTWKIKGLEFKQITFDEQIKGIATFICWICVFMSTYLYIQALGWDSIHIVHGKKLVGEGAFAHRIVGTLGNPTVVSNWYAVTLPMFFLQTARKYKFLFVYCFLSVLLTQGRLGIASIIVTSLVVAFYKNKKLFIGILLILAIGLGLTFFHPKLKMNMNPHGRIKVWEIIYDAWYKEYNNPKTGLSRKGASLFGYGPGQFKYMIPDITDNNKVAGTVGWTEAHCEPFEIAFNYGVVGLLFYVGFCISVIREFLIKKKTWIKIVLFSGLVGFFMTNLAFFPIHMGGIIFITVIYLGLLMNLQGRESNEKIVGFRNFARRAFTMQ